MYELHRHSKTCRKYKNKACTFKFGKFLSKETLVAEPLPESMPEEVKVLVLSKRRKILLKVKGYIKDFLNPSKAKFFDPSRGDSTEKKSISEVLKELNISEKEHENALKISDENGFQLHLRQPTNSCFFNNYFDIGLLAWEANIDIQQVFDYYKAVSYIYV